MATEGSKSVTVTSWDTLKFSWWEDSQSITNNTTTIMWQMDLIAGSSGRIDSSASKSWSVTVNGVTYSGTNTVGVANNATKKLAGGKTTISHNADGTKTFSYSFSQEFGITFSGSSIGTKSGSGTGTLDTIPRKSTLAAGNGTLGTALTLTVTKQSSGFTHTITYKCGSASGTVCTKASGTSIAWNTSNGNTLDLAKQNTAGTSVSVTFTITTYNGSASLGSNTKSVTMSIPASVKPSCSISVSDAAGHLATYGAYIKGLSKFAVTVTPTLAYGSAIASYNTTANGVRYTAASFTTGFLTSSGTLTISATVTDKRGRSGTASKNVSVIDYAIPNIALVKVKRCVSLEDGTEDINGEFAQVTFSANVTALNNKNTARYTLQYKQASAEWEDATSVELTDYANNYNVTEGYYRFAADSGSSYSVRIVVTDNFTTGYGVTPLSTGAVMEHWRADGKGMGFGKMGEVVNGADFGWAIKPNGGFINIKLDPETDLNDVTAPNTYIGENTSTYNYKNCPITAGTFTLEVASGGDNGQVMQTLTVISKATHARYKRFFYISEWGEWVREHANGGTVLAAPNWYMSDGQTVTLPERISYQPHGIVLVWSLYIDDADGPREAEFFSHFIPKYVVSAHGGVGHNFNLCGMWRNAVKYLYIHDDRIVGHANNKTAMTVGGITHANNNFVLRYVIGV